MVLTANQEHIRTARVLKGDSSRPFVCSVGLMYSWEHFVDSWIRFTEKLRPVCSLLVARDKHWQKLIIHYLGRQQETVKMCVDKDEAIIVWPNKMIGILLPE